MNTDLLPREGRILCAVSGGIDSMYLLCRLRELGYDAAAAHYNHGLRGAEADRDETFVRDFCAARGISFLSERGDVSAAAAAEHTGVEQTARTMRYAFLERAADALGCAVIATAHNADDNSETVLLNLTRGAGLRGLGGIPPVRGRIVRPMLDVTRREAEAYLAEHGIPHVEDSSNDGDEFTRNRIRHEVTPRLKAVNPAFAQAVGRTATRLRRDEEFLSGLARTFVSENAQGRSLPWRALLAQPEPVASRAIRLMAGEGLDAGHVDAVLRTAAEGGMADVSGLRVARWGQWLVFGVAQAAPLPERVLPPDGRVDLPEAGLSASCAAWSEDLPSVHKPFNIFFFKCENICGNITIASRRFGDAFRPVGRGCTKTLKQLFQETRIPPWERAAVPVLRDEAGVIGVYGVGAAERAAANAGDRNIYRIEFTRLGESE